MKKKLVLQFRTDKSLIHERACIIQAGSFNEDELDFINILDRHSQAPASINLNLYRGVILGGSGEVSISNWSSERKKMILRSELLLKQIIKRGIPMLGICFGHQLISYILGGKIKADPNQAEIGAYEIFLTEKGMKSPLFRDLPKVFYAVEGHKDSVVSLPKNAVLLATSKRCGVEAYQIRNNIFGVQFHPELDKKGMKYRLNLFPDYTKGKNINEILNDYQETPFARKIVENFKIFIV